MGDEPPPPEEAPVAPEGDAPEGDAAEGEGGEAEFPVIMKDSDEWKNCAAFGHFAVDGGPPEGAWPLYMQPDTLEEYGVPKIDDQICWGWVDKEKVKKESMDKGAMCDWDPIKANLFAIEVRKPLFSCLSSCQSSERRLLASAQRRTRCSLARYLARVVLISRGCSVRAGGEVLARVRRGRGARG